VGSESLAGRSPEIADGFVAIGQIGKCWGIRGEVKVTLHTDFPEQFLTLKTVYLGPEAQPARLLSCRLHKGYILMQLADYEDRTAAEALRGVWVQIPRDELVPLEEGEVFAFQLAGMRVLTTDGRLVGVVSEVLFTGANEVLVVTGEQGEVLVPYIEDVIVAEDFETGSIQIEPLPGLLD
jgi:16S rRNA processing protein RimM